MDVDSASAARRRRERRLRLWLRHERMTVAMALAEKLHHTSRGQRFARAREEGHRRGFGGDAGVGIFRAPPGYPGVERQLSEPSMMKSSSSSRAPAQ